MDYGCLKMDLQSGLSGIGDVDESGRWKEKSGPLVARQT